MNKQLIKKWKSLCEKTECHSVKKLNEGWSGPDGEKAYDQILEAFEFMSKEDILNMLWSYLSVDELQNIHKWMKEEEYFVDDEDED